MSKKEVQVIFETITPLFTGDAWQESKEIRPSSLLGSLRFWFSFYWKLIKDGKVERLNEKNVVSENLHELEKKMGKSLNKLIKKYLKNSSSLDEAIDKSLNTLRLSLPSRIFGCTGWKSRLSILIRDFDVVELRYSDLEFSFPDPLSKKDIEFWIKKSLFHENETIKVFSNIKTLIKVPEYWWEKYLKDFFRFFSNKLILVGGKGSFGFGFVKLSIHFHESGSIENSEIGNFRKYYFKDIISLNLNNQSKEILGYNFRYYLRKRHKGFRKQNFGGQGKSSKIYISNLRRNSKNIYFLVINNPFNSEFIPEKVIKIYIDFLKKLEGS